MKWFSALALRSFISGMFLTDGNSEWPGIGINRRGEDMIIPCLVKGSVKQKNYCASAYRRDNTLSLLIVRPSTKVFVGHASVLIGYRFGSLCVRVLIIVSRHCSSDVVECSADKC